MAKKPSTASLPVRGAARFKQSELARAIRAAKDAGGERVEVDPETGKIAVIVGKSEDSPASNPWDEVHAADEKRAS